MHILILSCIFVLTKQININIKKDKMKNLKKITKKEIESNIEQIKVTPSRNYYEYETPERTFSVNTYLFGLNCEQISDNENHGFGFCSTKKEFINFLYEELNK